MIHLVTYAHQATLICACRGYLHRLLRAGHTHRRFLRSSTLRHRRSAYVQGIRHFRLAPADRHEYVRTSVCMSGGALDKRLQAGTTPKTAFPNVHLSMHLGESSREVLTQASRSSQLNRAVIPRERPVSLDKWCLQGRCKTPLSHTACKPGTHPHHSDA
jgi:hypothetical protein